MLFTLSSDYKPTGDQPQAIEQLVASVAAGNRFQTLLGVTGSGKTFTMANVIARCERPTLIISHNKTLAAQLTQSSKTSFRTTPSNTSSATTTITSPRPTFRRAIPSSKKTRRSTRRSNGCGLRQRVRWCRGAT